MSTETYPPAVLDHLESKTDDPAALAEIEHLREQPWHPASRGWVG